MCKSNFKLNDKIEVAQGIVAPQDTVNRASQKKLGNGINVGAGIFYLSNIEKNKIMFNDNELELIKPFYTTAELGRYYGNPKNNYWVIYTNSLFKNKRRIKPYPNIKAHLDKFASVITSVNGPYGLHRARKEYFFQGEKILSIRKCLSPTFTYTNFDCYVSQTYFIIKSTRINLKYLTGLLNSKLIAYWLRNKGKMQGNNFQIDKEPILEIPIYNPPDTTLITSIVDKILESLVKKKNASKLENEIDTMVYKLYGLNYAEVKIVDPELAMSEQGYNKLHFDFME